MNELLKQRDDLRDALDVLILVPESERSAAFNKVLEGFNLLSVELDAFNEKLTQVRSAMPSLPF